jgi:hypothetical protein
MKAWRNERWGAGKREEGRTKKLKVTIERQISSELEPDQYVMPDGRVETERDTQHLHRWW